MHFSESRVHIDEFMIIDSITFSVLLLLLVMECSAQWTQMVTLTQTELFSHKPAYQALRQYNHQTTAVRYTYKDSYHAHVQCQHASDQLHKHKSGIQYSSEWCSSLPALCLDIIILYFVSHSLFFFVCFSFDN